MNGMKPGKLERIIIFALIFAIMAACSMMYMGDSVRVAEATGFQGNGETYSGGSSSSSSSSSSKPSSSEEDTEPEGNIFGDALKDLEKSIGKLEDGTDPGKYADVKAPAWVLKLNDRSRELAARIAVGLQSILLGTAGLWYLHCIIAICSDTWFQMWCGFKYPMFSKQLYEVKASAGVMPQPRNNQGNSQYMNNQYMNNPNMNNQHMNNMNQQMNQQGGQQGNGRGVPGVFSQIGTFTFKHVIFMALMIALMFVISQGYIEGMILKVLSTIVSALGAV